MDAMQAHDNPSLEVEVRVENVTVPTNITSIRGQTDYWSAVSPYRTNRAQTTPLRTRATQLRQTLRSRMAAAWNDNTSVSRTALK